MGQPDAAEKPIIEAVILDLDGTLIDTESLVKEVGQILVEKYGKKFTGEGDELRLGKRPLEGAQTMVDQYSLPCTAEDFLQQSKELLSSRWSRAKPLPGAERLLKYLTRHGIPTALASSSPRFNIGNKLSYQKGWVEMLQISIAGDEVKNGKPDPEIFLKAAELLKVDPSKCLVVEDAPAGAEAAKRAGMKVVVVPSLPHKSARPLYSALGTEEEGDAYLASLLDLRPQAWGLPAFDDWIAQTLPIDPWRVGGPVVKGFGRGSKVLGIPTANLPKESISNHVAEHVCGIYLGWAALANRGIFKMVMSVGWNPYFDNKHKTVEPWLLHEFEDDFYEEELRLVVVGYIRPEANFPSLDALIARIKQDGKLAEAALEEAPFATFRKDSYLTSLLESST